MPLKLFLGAVATAALGMGLVACSDNSGDTSSTSTMPSTAVPTQTRTPSSAVAGISPPDAYSAYVGQLCEAGKQFRDDMESAAGGAASDPQGTFDAVRQAFDRFTASAKATQPPPELQSWQQDLIDRFDKVSQAMNDHDPSALNSALDPQFPSVPDAAKANLKSEATNNPDCQAAGLFG